MSLRIVHAADLHIDSPLRGLGRLDDDAPLEDFRLATRRAFQRLVDLCLDERAALLLLAGDIFDGEWPDYNSGIFFARQLARLAQVGTRVVVLRGNHDAASVIAYDQVKLPDFVRLLRHESPETVVYDELGVAVHGQSYASKAVTDNLARSYPRPVAGALNIGLLHTNATGTADHDPYAPCTAEQLAAHGYDYWALGHVHERARLAEAPWIVYPGNLQGRHARETGAKGCTVITVDGGRIVDVSPRVVDVARWAQIRVDAGALSTVDEVADAVRTQAEAERAAAGSRPILARVVIEGASPAHGALAQLAARDDGVRALVKSVLAHVGDVWPEKIALATRARSRTSGAADSSFLAALAAELEQLAREVPADTLARLVPIADKTKKYVPGDPLDSADRVRALLPEIEALLAGKLHGGEGGEGAS